MIGALNYLQVGAGAVAGALLVSGPVYLAGKSAARSEAAVSVMRETVQAYQTREEINDDVQASDLTSLCIELGGLPEQCAIELRRLDEAAIGK